MLQVKETFFLCFLAKRWTVGLAAEANLDAAGRCALASVLVCQHGLSETLNSMEVTAFQQENGYKKTSTLANGAPQRGETAFRSAVPCAWSPRVPQALASNYQRFRSCEGSSTVRKPWPGEQKRPSQGDRRYKRVETADTVGALFGAAPHPCATNLQRNDAKQERGRAREARVTHAGAVRCTASW